MHLRRLGAVVLIALFKCRELFFCLVLAYSIGFLNFSDELITLPCNLIQVLISELAPLFSHLAFKLFPISFNDVPIHLDLQTPYMMGGDDDMTIHPRKNSLSSIKDWTC